MSDDVPTLTKAIGDLYSVFGRYSAEGLEGHPPCRSVEHEKYLSSQPLRHLTAEDLREYSSRALTTVGSIENFKHFLPQIFELVASHGDAEFQVEIVFGKLGYGRWQNWPARERHAVELFFRAMWRDLLRRYPHAIEADSLLCGIGNSVDDLAPYLLEWEEIDSEAAVLHLADFITAHDVGNHPRPPALRDPFWDGRERQATQVLQWLLRMERSQQLERAFFDAGNSEAQQLLSDAIAAHERIRQRVDVFRKDRR